MAPMERGTCLQGILQISHKPYLSGSLGKEPLFSSPQGVPSQRDAPPLETTFFNLSNSPVYEPPPPKYQVPLGWNIVPIARDIVKVCITELQVTLQFTVFIATTAQ